MKIIAVANQKGGVAKTTTVVNLAYELACLSQKVLLIDLDPQASATSSIFGNIEFEKTIHDLFVSDIPVEQIIQRSNIFNVDVIPSDIMLSGIDIQIAQMIGREKILYHKIKDLKNYDVVIIDSPPSLGLLTINALTTAKELLITICPEYFSLRGITLLESTIKKIQENLDNPIKIVGVLITRYKSRVITNDAISIIKDHFADTMFNTAIPENIKIEEAHNKHVPVRKYDPSCKGAIAYQQLAEEVLSRWQNQKLTTHSL